MAYQPVSTVRDLGIPSLMDYAKEGLKKKSPDEQQVSTPVQPNESTERREPVFSGLLGPALGNSYSGYSTIDDYISGANQSEPYSDEPLSFEEAGLNEQDYSFYQDWLDDPTLKDDYGSWEDYLGFRQSMEGGFY